MRDGEAETIVRLFEKNICRSTERQNDLRRELLERGAVMGKPAGDIDVDLESSRVVFSGLPLRIQLLGTEVDGTGWFNAWALPKVFPAAARRASERLRDKAGLDLFQAEGLAMDGGIIAVVASGILGCET